MDVFRLAAAMVLLVGCGATVTYGAGPATPERPATPAGPAIPESSAPTSWFMFGLQVSQQLEARLADANDPLVAQLQQTVDQELDSQTATGATPRVASPVVRLWFDRTGRIIRAEHTSTGDPQADRDLDEVLKSQTINTPPPPGMRQPLVLRINITNQS